MFKICCVLCSEPDKHYLMYEHERVPIAVCEKEPSSIIAFALRYISFLYWFYSFVFLTFTFRKQNASSYWGCCRVMLKLS